MKSCHLFFLGFETDRTQAYNFAKYAKARKGPDGKIDKKSKSPFTKIIKKSVEITEI